jgi:hypothetical protein
MTDMSAKTVSYPLYSMGDRIPLTPQASPWNLINPLNTPAEVFIAAGTVTLIEFSRDQTNWDLVGLLGGQYRLNPGDALRITYIVAPTVVAYPF